MQKSGIVRDGQGLYPVLCAWCVLHGRPPAVIRMADYPDSHGICEECREAEGMNGINADNTF